VNLRELNEIDYNTAAYYYENDGGQGGAYSYVGEYADYYVYSENEGEGEGYFYSYDDNGYYDDVDDDENETEEEVDTPDVIDMVSASPTESPTESFTVITNQRTVFGKVMGNTLNFFYFVGGIVVMAAFVSCFCSYRKRSEVSYSPVHMGENDDEGEAFTGTRETEMSNWPR